MRITSFFKVTMRGNYTRLNKIAQHSGDKGIEKDWILKVMDQLGPNDKLVIRQRIKKDSYVLGGKPDE